MYTFYSSCVNIPRDQVNDLRDMIEAGKTISYSAFVKYVPVQELSEMMPFYSWGHEKGLHLSKDWAVQYERSTFRGQPCVYMTHSAIEYIWIKD